MLNNIPLNEERSSNASSARGLAFRLFGRISFVLMTISLALAASSVPAQNVQFFQGFEVDSSGWTASATAPFNRVTTGTNGIPSRSGGFHQEIKRPFTQWGGYNSVFPAHGYTTSVRIYLDMGVGVANDTRFDFSSAINNTNPAPTHRRDFVFWGGFYNDADAFGSGPRFVVNTGTTTPGWPKADPTAAIITTSGWYTFQHRFYDSGAGVLAVEMSIIDSANVTIFSETKSDPTDIIGSTVGGNRYGWMVTNNFPFLAIDDSERVNIIETLYVDDDGTADENGCDTGIAHMTIAAAIAAAAPGDIISVCPGTYNEDVTVNKAGLKVRGSGAANTTVSGPISAPSNATFQIAANNVDLSGFTITRDGNNTTDWNNANLNIAGIAIQGAFTGAVIHDNVITGMRTAIDINNSSGHTVRNNVIDNNHTGMLMRNQTDNLVVVENFITNNRTVGVLFIDASSGSNVPVQTCANCTFSNNNISGNWYGEIVDRQSGGSLPAPGTTNLKNFRYNWFGTTSPVVTTANSAEPGYAVHIPVAYGGTATDPGGQPDIAGPASANFQITPMLTSGVDTDVETTPGRGTFGFQGAPVQINGANPQGWVFFNETLNGTGNFSFGPATPPAGIGSARLTVDSTGGHAIGTFQFAGTRLADISAMRYSTYQNNAGNPGPQAIALQFEVDSNLNDVDTSFQGRLVFEPYQTPANIVQQDVWQEWDTLQGRWWGTGSGASRPVSVACPQSSPCTTAQILSLFPNVGVRAQVTPTAGIFLFKAGGGWTGGFDGNVDKLVTTINGLTTVTDFEPTTPTVTINQAAGQADPTGTAPINFTVTFSEPVAGFTDADVVLGGATGASTVVVTGGPTVYNVAVSGMNADGILTASIGAAAAQGTVSGAPSDASTSTDNSVHFFITCVDVSMSTQNTLTGLPITVPVTVSNMTARDAKSADFTVTYNSSVLSFTNATLGAVGLANHPGPGTRTVTINSSISGSVGTLVFSIFGPAEFQGAGTLIDLNFMVTGAPATTSAVSFTDFEFNEGFPCDNTTNGAVNVTSGTISGKVLYGNPIGTPVPPRAVPGVTLNAAGSPPVSSVTANDGTYSLSGMGAGAYTVTPSKTGDVLGAIAGLDAADIASHVVGNITLNATQIIVADVSGNGTVTSFDAAMIASYVVALPGTGQTGTWKFVPANRPYADVNTNHVNQDYSALLMGDVTGNWDHPAGIPNLTIEPEGDPLMVRAGKVSGASGTTLSVPVTIGDTTGLGIRAYSFDLYYDADVLEPAMSAAELAIVSEGRSLTINATEKGVIRAVAFGALPLEGEGELLKLNFNVIGAADSRSVLRWENFRINEGGIKFQADNGEVNVSAAAENGAISGRLLDPRGQGVARTRVTVTDTQGNERSVNTSTLGYFQVSDLRVGETYVVTAASRRYRFAAQAVSITDGNAVELVMIGLE